MALLATLVLSGTGWAVVVPLEVGPFEFCAPGEYEDNVVELRRDLDITQGLDFGNTGHCAVNFKGAAGAAGDTWLTYADEAGPLSASDTVCVGADILINKFNNAKGGGVVALLDPGSGGKGLFLLVTDKGNNDRLTLNTIDPNSGKIVEIDPVDASFSLGSFVSENAWYRVALFVTASETDDKLEGFVVLMRYTDPTNPNSFPDTGSSIVANFETSRAEAGVAPEGFVGMAARAKSAVVNTSMTNFFARTNAFDVFPFCKSGLP